MTGLNLVEVPLRARVLCLGHSLCQGRSLHIPACWGWELCGLWVSLGAAEGAS